MAGDGVERRGLMFVLSSPSGAGKTTLARELMSKVAGLQMSVSVTTRPMRPGEVEGKDYFFIDKQRFDAMVKNNELLEHAPVFDHFYGTPRAPVEAQDVVSVFILPPSAADLEKRLHTRAQDSDAVIRGRMSRASHEMSHWAEYDYIVINRSIEEAFAEVKAILKAERLRRDRRTGLTGFVRKLQKQLEP
jgi:guanylate kinase